MNPKIRHKPHKGILDRDLAREKDRELIDRWTAYLEELCNYGSNLLVRCEKSMKGVEGTPSSLFFLYYHVIRMADGICASCSQACFAASIPMVRSLWEAELSMAYMLQKDFELRSAAWLAHSHAKSLLFFDSVDPSTKDGASVQAKQPIDRMFSQKAFPRFSQEKLDSARREIREKLNNAKFRRAYKGLTKKSGGPKTWWFSVNGGPDSLRKLAEDMNRPLEHKFLYRDFSEVSHAGNTNKAQFSAGESHFIAPIRNNSDADLVYRTTACTLIVASKAIAGKLRPQEQVRSDLNEIVNRHGMHGNSQ